MFLFAEFFLNNLVVQQKDPSIVVKADNTVNALKTTNPNIPTTCSAVLKYPPNLVTVSAAVPSAFNNAKDMLMQNYNKLASFKKYFFTKVAKHDMSYFLELNAKVSC